MPGSFLASAMNSASVAGAAGFAEKIVGRLDQRGDRGEVLDRVVAEARVERRIDGERAGIAEHQHMAVGRRLRHHVGGDDAAGARHVLDDERLAERRGEFLREQPRQHVRIAAGTGGRDQPHRSGRPGLVLRHRRGRRGRRAPMSGLRNGVACSSPFKPERAGKSHASPQMSRASSTTSRSFCSCTSGVIGLPVSTLAKPHCGLTARLSRSRWRVASSMRRLQLVLALHRRRLGRDQAEHHGLVARHEAQRREPAGARRVVLQEVERNVRAH